MSRHAEEDEGTVELEYTDKLHETDKAILFRFESGDEDWIPKRDDILICHDESEKKITVVRWIAVDKGLV